MHKSTPCVNDCERYELKKTIKQTNNDIISIKMSFSKLEFNFNLKKLTCYIIAVVTCYASLPEIKHSLGAIMEASNDK